MSITSRIANTSRELRLFAISILVMGIAYSMFDSIFNNYLNNRYNLTGFQRSFLELPREIPGFLVVFISALLWFLCSRRLAAIAMLLGAVSTILIGFASPFYAMLVLWLFIYNLGSHIFMPLATTIGMELAKEGKDGQRLGQLNAIRNLATILGSFLVFVGFKYLKFTFQHIFILASIALAIAAVLFFRMKADKTQPPKTYLTLHRQYSLYYLLSILFGSRKQLFITFAPWVLVTIFNQPTQTLATLYMLGGVIGIIFQPFLGKAIDRLGERRILCGEALLLVVVCLGYGFGKFIFSENVAFILACACFLVDQMLMSVNMARSTYMKKIALDPTHIQPALTASVTIDHIFSIGIALLGGLIWSSFGFQYVFLMGVLIALFNFMAALRIKIPRSPIKVPNSIG